MQYEEIRSAFSEVYNKFYLTYRYKGNKRSDEEWKNIVEQADSIIKKYNNSPLVKHMVLDLLEIFENDEKG